MDVVSISDPCEQSCSAPSAAPIAPGAEAMAAKREQILAAVAAARKNASPEGSQADAADELTRRRAEIAASVATARKEAAGEAAVAEARRAMSQAKGEQGRQTRGEGEAARKVTAKDLFGMEAMLAEEAKSLARDEVRDYRMQGNYGATKFIKP